LRYNWRKPFSLYNPAHKADIEKGGKFIENRVAELKVLSQNERKYAKEPKWAGGDFPHAFGITASE
jgi:hypothetical protein